MTKNRFRNSIFFALLPLLTISFVSNITPYVYIPSLPDAAREFCVSEAQGGGAISVFYLVLSLVLLLVGIVGHVWDKKRLLVLATLLITAGAVLSGSASDFILFQSGWGVQALGAAIVLVTGQAWIGQRSNKSNITSLFSMFAIFLSLAPLVATIAGGIANDAFGWRFNFYMVAMLSFCALLLIKRLTPPAPEQQRVSATKVLGGYYDILFRSKFVGIVIMSLACFLFQGALMAYSSFLFIDEFGMKPAAYGFISVPVIAGIIIGQFPVIYIEKRKGVVAAHYFNSLMAILALAITAAYYIIAGKHTILELAIVIFLFNVGFGGHTLLALSSVMSAFPGKRSYASALLNFANQFVSYLASLLVQALFLLVDSAVQVHNIISIGTLVLILFLLPSFKRSMT